MLSAYKQILRQSLKDRKGAASCAVNGLLPLVVLGVSVYILAAIQLAPDYYPERHFNEERGLITALSAIFLAMASSLAGASFLLGFRKSRGLGLFWGLAAVSFFFLALDELLGFHEKLGDMMKNAIGSPLIFRNWNDVVIIIYGVAAVFILLYFLPAMIRLPAFFKMMVLAFGFFVIHTLIDSTQVRTMYSIVFEESAKLFSSAFFAMAMLYGLLAVVEEKGGRP